MPRVSDEAIKWVIDRCGYDVPYYDVLKLAHDLLEARRERDAPARRGKDDGDPVHARAPRSLEREDRRLAVGSRAQRQGAHAIRTSAPSTSLVESLEGAHGRRFNW